MLLCCSNGMVWGTGPAGFGIPLSRLCLRSALIFFLISSLICSRASRKNYSTSLLWSRMTWDRAFTLRSSPFFERIISRRSIKWDYLNTLTDHLFLLVSNDLVMLIPNEFLFLLKILNNLSKGFFKHLDFAFEDSDLLLLGFPSLIVLINST